MVVDTKLYDILGVKPEATDRELKKAFMVKARELHPDKNKDDPNATEKFQELNEAYEVLKNPDTRKLYDEYGPEGLKEGAGMDSGFDDLLSHLFGFGSSGMSGESRRPKTRDIVREIPATLEELYNGAEKEITIERHVICPACKGTGCKEGKKPKECETCKGKGQVIGIQNVPGMGHVQTVQTCPKCHGACHTIADEDKCEKCDGETIVQEEKKFVCHIERGMEDGSHIVFTGESDEVPGADQGDVVIVVREESHPVFVRRHDDLLYKKEVNLYEALFGATFLIDTLDDRQLLVKTNPGEVLTPDVVKSIEREGMPTKENPYNRGKLFIQFTVKFPESAELTEDLKKALLAISPPQKLPAYKEEDVFPAHLQDADIDEFKKNRASHSTKRNEAYRSDDEQDQYDEDEYMEGGDYSDEEGGNGGAQGCQPM